MGMDKRALWSRILVIIGLMLMGIGYRYPVLILPGIMVATVGAILSKSPRRKILLWGAGIVAAGLAAGFIFGIIVGMTGKTRIPSLPIFIGIPSFFGVIITAIGAIAILTDKKQPASPSSPGS
jgi:hypothetical protein